MNNKKFWIFISAVSGFTAVAIGAFGSHGLKEKLTPEMIEVYKTGVLYHLIHTVVLLAISLSDKIKTQLPSIFFLLGIILFSFSLYIYSTSGIRFFAMITPIGGVSFLIAWLMIIVSLRKGLKDGSLN
ncbi:MAG: DUF423 domain-containing protein [Ignavibacterium album]|jgi:uncharacterized membrane protein YgdD (TMEM256/DUF423 family)|uniref:DUF423 domain-containing protein n=1 Tax=Ignavibacterium album TaxID=591197 RepID=UPI0026EED392|nr:DUF423 domain-containing protein [Ignavibacterium album]MCX8106431.1 DUF423 domain-containing protein [Ignavibacterium album]